MVNPLYPAFFRLDRLQMLVVGAGMVGEEKLKFILKSSPNASVTIVAPEMGEELRGLLESYQERTMEEAGPQVQADPQLTEILSTEGTGQLDPVKLKGRSIQFFDALYTLGTEIGGLYFTPAGGNVMWLKREFNPEDVESADLVIAATDIKEVNRSVYEAAKQHRRLCNIADTPDLCDFYLGSIVTRGPLKVAISTNGQSPTFAKRFRQFLEAELPELETTNLLDNLKLFRDRLTGNFSAKVRELNTVTNSLLASGPEENQVRSCPPGGCLLAATHAATAAASPAPTAPPNEEN